MSDNDTDLGTFLAGFIIGGLIGGAAALLMAPQSGEETRTLIRDKSIELKDRAVETAEEAITRAEKALDEARMRAEDAIEEVRIRTEELAEITRQRATDLQQRGQVVLEEQRARLGGAADAGKKAAQQAQDDLSSQTNTQMPE
jgi:gas vesicle protein